MIHIYHNDLGEILYTLELGVDISPPEGAHITVPQGTVINALDMIVSDGELIPRPLLTDDQRAAAAAIVAEARGLARKHFITDLPGQEMVYLEKRSEAVAYLADPAPDISDYPMIEREIGITGTTAYEVAQVWINMSNLWRYASGIIEQATLGAYAAIDAATTKAEVDLAIAGMTSALDALISPSI